jgi:PEP-CTERM motif
VFHAKPKTQKQGKYMTKSQIITAVALMAAAVAARAQFYTEIDISSQVNADLQTYTSGGDYQVGGSQLNAGGVPFGLALLDNTPGTTGVLQTPYNGGQVESYTFYVPSGTYATALYTLINTSWGDDGVNEGSVVVTGSGGETATLDLIEGFNIRDHYNGFYCNTYTDPTLVPTYFANQVPNSTDGPVRLDRQMLVLPSSFNGDTVASITFNGIGNGQPDGSPFLAGMTLQTVPEPDSLIVLGLGTLILVVRRARQ